MGCATNDPLLGTMVAERFRIEERLGQGGMGVVYRARQEHVERPVAVKVLHPERAHDEDAAAQFLREARAVSQLTSPHTVTLIDVGPFGAAGWFLAMELLDGRPLRSLLDEGPVPPDRAVRIAEQIALSLGEAHQRGIVHRDLKPLNVFLARTPGHAEAVKVLDFGLASLSRETEEAATGGTPRYMAPEAIAGGTAQPRVDVYALGLMLYEMLAGAHPFQGLRGDALLDAHLSTPAPPLPDDVEVSPALRKLVQQCLAKHPRLRPRNGTDFRERLRRAHGLPEELAADASVPPSSSQPPAHELDTKATFPSTLSLARLRARLEPERTTRLWWGLPIVAMVAGAVWWQQARRQEGAMWQPTPSLRATSTPRTAERSVPAPSVVVADPADTADILFHTIPDGATVRIDGKVLGKTPKSISLAVGRAVKVDLDLSGHRKASLELTPVADKRIRHVFVRSTPRPDPATEKVDRYLD